MDQPFSLDNTLRVSRKDILHFADHDPIIQTVLGYWRRGDITWEEAMMTCVAELSQDRHRLREKLKTLMSNTTTPIIPVPKP